MTAYTAALIGEDYCAELKNEFTRSRMRKQEFCCPGCAMDYCQRCIHGTTVPKGDWSCGARCEGGALNELRTFNPRPKKRRSYNGGVNKTLTEFADAVIRGFSILWRQQNQSQPSMILSTLPVQAIRQYATQPMQLDDESSDASFTSSTAPTTAPSSTAAWSMVSEATTNTVVIDD